MNSLIDIKTTLRRLYRTPKFTALALFVLIGGLSISLFTFSFLYTVVYKPLPLPEGETALQITVATDGRGQLVPAYELTEVRDDLTSLTELGMFRDAGVRLNVGDVGRSVMTTYAESDLFDYSRSTPLLGRVFQAEDYRSGAEPVVVISHSIWQNDLGGRKSILGETVRLDNRQTTIVGVMPDQYQFPRASYLWLPLSDAMRNPQADSTDHLRAYARLSVGATIDQAEAELTDRLNQVYRQGVEQYAKRDGFLSASLVSFPVAVMDGDGAMIFTFFNLVAFSILLLACANTGNLLLARAVERHKETAIRSALGAPPRRLITQLMWEGVLITVVGTVLSVLLVGAALYYADLFLRSVIPEGLAFWWRWGLDGATLLMAALFASVTLFLASFLPAWRAVSQNVSATLRDGTRGAQSGKASRLSRALVTTQVFLISALMLMGSISAFMSHQLLNLDIGVDLDGILSAEMVLSEDPNQRYTEPEQQIAFYQRLINILDQDPQITGASVSTSMGRLAVRIPGLTESSDTPANQGARAVYTDAIMANELTFGLTLLDGRSIGPQDRMGARKTALISQSMARRYWPDQSAIEQALQINVADEWLDLTVVGVVNDQINGRALFASADAEDEMYVSGYQFASANQGVWFRSRPGSSGQIEQANRRAEDALYQALYGIDSGIMPVRVRVAKQNMEMMQGSMRLTANLTFISGGFALLLALTGIYGLTANAVTQRTHEIGIRRAVGASDRQIIRLFLIQGSRQLLIGLGLGLLVFAVLAVLFQQFAENVLPWHLYLWLGATVSIGLSAVIMSAIYMPTRRAVSMEPGMALRHE